MIINNNKSYGLGAVVIDDNTIEFKIVSQSNECGVKIYSRKSGKLLKKIFVDRALNVGNVRTAVCYGLKADEISYIFFEGEDVVIDSRAKAFEKNIQYKSVRKNFRAVFPSKDFDWENDEKPENAYNDSLIYLIHTRGFTQHNSSNVKNRGTFLGIVEKIDYLKSIGVTCIELQPSYEFFEIPTAYERSSSLKYPVEMSRLDEVVPEKLNYWGYKTGLYFMPKTSYCATDNCVDEFKTLVRELHKNKIELVMQFYFDNKTSTSDIDDIFRFWVEEYHVDGFHILGENIDTKSILSNPYLARTKIWYNHFEEGSYNQNRALYKDDYMYNTRRFLKGDEDQTRNVLYQMKYNPFNMGVINFISNYYGFTLMDLVSYDYKHNEENGENNRDGNDYNCSWNCGDEGNTRKKKVRELRFKQIKNAYAFLLLSQGTPLIFMGDEFGNSQNGNNNPYCIDSSVTWLNWNLINKNKDLHDYWKELVNLRFSHSLLHLSEEPKGLDYISCGYPDISFHGRNPWRPEIEVYSRFIGIMYSGFYSQKKLDKDNDFIFIAINMHWEKHVFGMPKLPKGLKWELYSKTTEESIDPVDIRASEEQSFNIMPRSICIFKSYEVNNEKKYKNNKRIHSTF